MKICSLICPWTLSVPRSSQFSSSYALGKLFATRAAAARNSAENLDIFTTLSEKDGSVNQKDRLHVDLLSQLQHKDEKISPRSAFSLQVRSFRRLQIFAL